MTGCLLCACLKRVEDSPLFLHELLVHVFVAGEICGMAGDSMFELCKTCVEKRVRIAKIHSMAVDRTS
jgi:hypothetical protein